MMFVLLGSAVSVDAQFGMEVNYAEAMSGKAYQPGLAVKFVFGRLAIARSFNYSSDDLDDELFFSVNYQFHIPVSMDNCS